VRGDPPYGSYVHTDRTLDLRDDALEELIAGAVTKRVVHRLEKVQVEEHQTERSLVTSCMRELGVET
jgi:hypothetical protein